MSTSETTRTPPALSQAAPAEPWSLGARPRFSFGQLLTDSDLTALVDWTDAKSSLTRLREGWGVVCGMDVYAGAADGEVTVDAGYAVDPAGRDLLLSEPASLSLSSCCTPPPSGCGAAVSSQPSLAQASFGEVEEKELRVLDLTAHYAEQSSEPRSVFGGVNGKPGSRSEYARTRTQPRIVCTLTAGESDPLELEAKSWEEGYSGCLAVLGRYREEAGKASPAEGRAWLLGWMDEHPLRHFPFVRAWVEARPDAEWSEKDAVHALFWMVQDARNRFLQATLPARQQDAGVPLARLWVRTGPSGDGQSACRVVSVDAQPPFRRPLQNDRWPARLHELNLARVLWRRVEEAQKIASGLGLKTNDPERFELPQTVEALEASLSGHKLMVGADSFVTLHYFHAGDLGFRVVGVQS